MSDVNIQRNCLELLALAKLADEYVVALVLSVLVTVVVRVSRSDGNDARIGGSQIGGGDVPCLVVITTDIESEFDGAVRAEVGACAVARELKGNVYVFRRLVDWFVRPKDTLL